MGEQLEVQNKQEQIKNSVADKQKANVDTFVGKLKDIQDDKDKTKEVTDVFTDNSDKILEGIKSNMIANFAKIDGKGETDPKLSTYEDAKNAFNTDINKLKTQNISVNKTPTEKTSKEEGKLNKLLEITSAIGSLIQLKKLESGKAVDADFNLETTGKLKYFIQDNNLEKNMMPKKELKKTRNELITEKSTNMQAKKESEENIKKEAEANTTKAREALNKNRTTETAKSFFETTNNEKDFNATFDEISSIEADKLEMYTNKDNTLQENKIKNFVSLIKKYTKDETITNISIKKASSTDETYPEGTRIIRFDAIIKGKAAKDGEPASPDETISKDIIFGSQDQMQAKKAEKFDISKVDLSKPNPLAQFDGKGNYKSLERYITTESNKNKFENNFKNIMDAILAYKKPETTTDKYEDVNDLKNGYANILTDYVIKNPSIRETYQTYLTNMNILGVDKTTRIANYTKLVVIRKGNRENMKSDEKQQILDLGKTIGVQEKMTPIEVASKGLDSLIKQFGPMLLSILKMFGLGKGSLTKMFGKEKINEIFAKEYGLDDGAAKAILEISEIYPDTDLTKTNQLSNPPTAKELKKSFGETDDEINEYIGRLTKDNYKYLNVSVVQKGVDLYNKSKNKQLNINDIVTITTDTSTKKQSITEIKDIDKSDNLFKGVMTSILKSDMPRTNIASANRELQTPGKVNQDYNEQGVKVDTKVDTKETSYGYRIKNKQDIVRYLTASIFSNKDLSYVMTENELHGEVTTKEEPVEKQKEEPTETVSINTKYATEANGIYTLKDVQTAKIQDIFTNRDAKSWPKELKFTPKSTGKEITIIQGKDPIDGKTDTYLYNGSRVKINIGDKIEAGTNTTKNPEQDANDLFSTNEKNVIDKLKKEPMDTFKYNPVATGNDKEYQENLMNMRGELGSITRVPDNKTSDLVSFNNRDLIIKRGGKIFGETTKDNNIYHLKNMFSMLNDKGSVTINNIANDGKVTKKTIDYRNSKLIEVINHLDPKKRSYEETIDQQSKSINLTIKEKGIVIGTIILTKDINGEPIPTRKEATKTAVVAK